MRIDAHQHFWRYTPDEFGWIDDASASLRRNWLPEDLRPLLQAAGIDGTIAVQARQSLRETQWLLQLAECSPEILGVVGWADLRSNDVSAVIEGLLADRKLCGLRHVVQAEPAGFLDGAEFNRGVGALGATRLVYDLLILSRQLEEATRFVDRHPNQRFVLDHIAKPNIAHDEIVAWKGGIRELAKRQNVCCKLSGMVTEAGDQWSEQKLQPYFDVVLEAFGTPRLMAATDWPVLTVHCTYSRWWSVLRCALAHLSPEERADVQGGVAARVYGLGQLQP